MIFSDLIMWKAVQTPTRLTNMAFNRVILIASARSGGYNVFIKWKWYENDYRKQIDYSAYSPHSLRAVTKPLAPYKGIQENSPVYVHFNLLHL